MRTIKECKEMIVDAVYNCAAGVANTGSAGTALTCADVCEKLSRALNYINQIKESEDK